MKLIICFTRKSFETEERLAQKRRQIKMAARNFEAAIMYEQLFY